FFTSGSNVAGALRLALSLKGMGAWVTNKATATAAATPSTMPRIRPNQALPERAGFFLRVAMTLHALRGADPKQAQAVGDHLGGGAGQAQAGGAQGGVVHQNAFGVVPGVEIGGAVAQPESQLVRRQLAGGLREYARVFRQA